MKGAADGLDCDCVKRFRSMIEDRRSNAKDMLEKDLPQRLEAFAEAMRLGAIQLVARHLLRASVFRASLDLNGSRDVSVDHILRVLRLVVDTRPRLKEFLPKYWDEIVSQAAYINPKDVLPKKIRNREHLSETFGGYIRGSLDAAEKSLDQLEALDRRLPAWKSFVRGVDVPRIEPIMDYHDYQK